MLGSLGDLVEDVVVHLGGPIRAATDTTAHIVHRRGGSAANVAASAADVGHPARFIGQVGDDRTGDVLVDDLTALGVEVVGPRQGRTGTVVALVDATGERSMLSDRGASTELDHVDPLWLDGLDTLHVPVYSLVVGALATTSARLIGMAHERGIRVSIDVSSVSVIEEYGIGQMIDLLGSLRPGVVLANEDEAACLTNDGLHRSQAQIVVVKQGGGPALLSTNGDPYRAIAAEPIPSVVDTTGAGDAFAAGLLVALAHGANPDDSVRAGHRLARRTIERHGSNSQAAPVDRP